jgi:hypothetical protein
MEMSESNDYGPNVYKRNEHGLLEKVTYSFNEDGSVDWRSMVKEEFLYPNKDWFEMRKKPVPSSVDGLKDNQLFIMLGGIKELAKLRGFESVSFNTENISEGYVKATCRIKWMQNYESGGISSSYEDVANASFDNTSSFASKFLETIACNRAFVRCVRNFLNIHIVGADEIDKSKEGSSVPYIEASSDEIHSVASLSPHAQLRMIYVDEMNGGSFEDFKELLRQFWTEGKYKNPDAKDWTQFDDIPVKEARKIRALLKKL